LDHPFAPARRSEREGSDGERDSLRAAFVVPDRSRIRFIAKLFRQHGLARAASDARARMLYTSYVGEQQIAVPLAAKRRVGSALAALEALLRVE
jgi:hypothetical protein